MVMCASSDPGPNSDLIRGQLSVHAGFDGKVISGAHVIRLVARLKEMIGRHASNGRDKLRWVRSNRDLDGRLKVVYSQRHAVAFHNYRPCLFYLYSSFILLLPASFTVILSEVIAPRHQQRPIISNRRDRSAQNIANRSPLVPECRARPRGIHNPRHGYRP
jgi:hypothetical protein